MDILKLLDGAGPSLERAMRALQKIHEGVTELKAELATGNRNGVERDLGLLTDRQKEIFTLIGQRVAVADIAKRLKISARTVDAHRNTIRIRLKFPEMDELTEFATSLAKEK